MELPAPPNSKKKWVAFRQLTIQQRLPLFIFILLLAIIAAFSWISYISVRNASLAIGTERAATLVDKLSLMFDESLNQFAATAGTIAGEQTVRDYLTSGDKKAGSGALDILQKSVKKDTLNKLVQLLDTRQQAVLGFGNTGLRPRVDINSLIVQSRGKAGGMSVGKIVLFKGSMYYPAFAVVTDKNKTIGYVINWRLMKATQKSIDQLAQLLGSDGKLYFGNDDEQFWTDMIKPVEKPPVNLSQLRHVAQYSRKDGQPLIGAMRQIPGSRWLVLVELSSSSFLETASHFLRWVIVIGLVLVVAGSLGGWFMSRNITRPIKELSKAASAIAEGDYSSPVDISSNDELGKLAESFNIMAARVRAVQEELQEKVQERTRELETAITDINDQKESDKKKDEFISVASHELKTPLTTLKAFFQLAGRELHPQLKSYNFIGNASRQLNRMDRLVTDLLDVSRINSGKMQYNFENFDFHTLLKDAVDSVQQISSGHTLILERSAHVVINGDRHRLEQVIVNLLNNALKYSPEADKVLIWSELQGDKLLITIKDFGIGIAKKHLDQLFERFYRVDVDHRYQGLGLGLFISAEIVKRHGGHIWVTSEPGNGSAFTFQLPV